MKKNIILIRILLILCLLFILILLFYFFPTFIIDEVNRRIHLDIIKENDKNFISTIMILSSSICCILCIFDIVLLWGLTIYFKKDKLFSKNALKIILIIILTLILSTTIFIISNLIYYNLKWSNYSLIYLCLPILNISLIPFFLFLYFLIKKQCISNLN